MPIQLDLSVTGSPEPGPRYAEGAATFGDGRAPAAEPDRAAQRAPAAGQDEATSSAGTAPLVWALAGAVLTLVVVGAVLAARTRRR